MLIQNVLKSFKLIAQRKDENSEMPINIPGINYYSPGKFKQRLLIEKRRAERLNSKSSMIIFNLADDNNNGLLYMKKADLEQYIKIICSNVRESDGVSYYDENKILILLPDTETENAQMVSANLMNQINLIENNGFAYSGESCHLFRFKPATP
jgi:hypothetical protein